MSSRQKSFHAVITGDVINSTQLGEIDLVSLLETACKQTVALLGPDHFPLDIDVFRGTPGRF